MLVFDHWGLRNPFYISSAHTKQEWIDGTYQILLSEAEHTFNDKIIEIIDDGYIETNLETGGGGR